MIRIHYILLAASAVLISVAIVNATTHYNNADLNHDHIVDGRDLSRYLTLYKDGMSK